MDRWTDQACADPPAAGAANERPAVFLDGAYEPVEVIGPDREHIVAFRRSRGHDRVVVAVGRHFARLNDFGQHGPIASGRRLSSTCGIVRACATHSPVTERNAIAENLSVVRRAPDRSAIRETNWRPTGFAALMPCLREHPNVDQLARHIRPA